MKDTRIHFKELVNKKIDIMNDILVQKTKKILAIKSPKLNGSYLKYGRSKACDLDMMEILSYDTNSKSHEIKAYCNKLISFKSDFILVKLKFNIYDVRFTNIINQLGYMDGNLKLYNLKLDKITESTDLHTIPTNIRNNIILLCNELKEHLTKNNYIKLVCYLYELSNPTWTLDEFKMGEKNINGQLIKLYESNFSSIYVQVIIDNFMVSNFIEFKDDFEEKNKEQMHMCKIYDMYDIIEYNMTTLSYYLLLKKFQVFLKWGYFNRIFKEHNLVKLAIITYNDIYDFREDIGIIYNKLCLLQTQIILCDNTALLQELKIQYEKDFIQFNNISKKYYYEKSKKYKIYLQNFVKFNLF